MRILIAAGGTLGHLFPAVIVAEGIREKRTKKILFVISNKKQDIELVREKNFNFRTVPIIGLQSKRLLGILKFIVCLVIGTIKSLFILLRFRPDRVVGFGGYVSGPIVILASLFRIRTIIHEQNVCPGRANMILAAFVDRIAVSFSQAIKYLKKFEKKIIVSGTPIRNGFQKIEKTGERFTALTIGGSQGAHTLNKLVPEAIGSLDEPKRKSLEVIHITGQNEREEVETRYKKSGIDSKVFSFISDMPRLYNESDFVLSRAGATTIAELLHTQKPAILIPYPHSNNHQLFNAKVLEELGSAVVFQEGSFTSGDLSKAISSLMDRKKLRDMSSRVKDFETKNARRILVEEIIR